MKDRIIRVLYGLTLPEEMYQKKKEVADESLLYLQNMPDELAKEDREVIRKKASRALRMILYDYSYFSVQTIDSFFQRVLRGFARELNLRFGYNIELDTDTALERVTDLLLKDAGDNSVLLDWLVRFIDEMSEDTGTWDIRKLILGQGHQIFSEPFKMIPPELLLRITNKEDGYLKQYLNDLSAIIGDFEQKMKDFGQKGLDIMWENNVSAGDFSSGNSGVAGIFQKLTEKNYIFGARFLDALDDPDRWLTKVRQKEPAMRHLVHEKLHPLSRELFAYFIAHYEDYYTALVIRSQIYILGILADLQNQLLQWMKDENRFLITEVGTFIRQIIGNNEAPFIYEKLGQFFEHYMIDEFQDTSRIQYENLKPLVKNSISSGYLSLIVGDIKQSIYRWRNGDWKIMGMELYEDFAREQLFKEVLNVNNRSLASVVQFNNAFFLEAPGQLWSLYESSFDNFLKSNRFLDLPQGTFQEEAGLNSQRDILFRIYSEEEVKQQVRPGKDGGYVSVKFLDNDDEETWKDKARVEVGGKIESLLTEEGYRPEQIVLLVRTNEEGRDIIRFLLTRQQEPGTLTYPLVSEDSLFLNSSAVVRFIVSFLRYLADKEDLLNFAVLWYLHDYLTGEKGLPAWHSKLPAEVQGEERFSFIPEVTKEWIMYLNRLPLTEMVQEVIRFFSLEKKKEEVPFIYTFQNFLADFVNRNSASLSGFLKWWDEQGNLQSVQMPEEVDAVRVMSIHKAKGLGAGIVMLPFADWRFEQPGSRTILWCHPQKKPFSAIPVIPLVYRQHMMKSIFREDYLMEHFSNYLDNLNLLYVAFTRAKERLYIWSAEGKKTGDTARLLRSVVEEMLEKKGKGAWEDLPVHWEEEQKIFEAGSPSKNQEQKREYGLKVDTYPVHTAFDRLRIARQGRRFFSLTATGTQEKIDRGNLYHALLSGIKTKEDLEPALKQSVITGLFPETEKDRIRKEIEKFLEQQGVEDWFSGRWEVRNEATIIHPGGKMLRPDRVMIRENEVIVVDYKFGETEESQYLTQIRRYMESLKEMGYHKVSGVIWYVTLNKRVYVDE